MLWNVMVCHAETVSTKPVGRFHDHGGSSTVLLMRWLAKGALLGLVVYGLLNPARLPTLVKHALYALGMYSFIGESEVAVHIT